MRVDEDSVRGDGKREVRGPKQARLGGSHRKNSCRSNGIQSK
jgi:hypothetical protein